MAEFKTRLIELLDLSHTFQQELIANLDPSVPTLTGTWENWSFKDELAHVVAWQLNSLARIAALISAEPIPNFDDFESINRAIYDTNRDRSLAEIVAEANRAYENFVKLVKSFSEEDLKRPAQFSSREQRTLAAQIMVDGCEHPNFHYASYYWRHGNLAKATEVQETSAAAVADMPDQYGTARYNLACFYALSGQVSKAVAELRAALRLKPDLVEWSKQDPDLTSLRDNPAYQALYQV